MEKPWRTLFSLTRAAAVAGALLALAGDMQAMLGGAKEVASFKAATAVQRGDFGVGVGNWAGNMVVGSEVGIEILLEAHRR